MSATVTNVSNYYNETDITLKKLTPAKMANIILTPIIIFGGLIGNLLSFCVFTFTHQHRISSPIYLSTLSLTDFGYLVVIIVSWLECLDPSFAVFKKSGWCKVLVYSFNFLSFVSVWLIVLCTFER